MSRTGMRAGPISAGVTALVVGLASVTPLSPAWAATAAGSPATTNSASTAAAPSPATLWRCEADGKISYSDLPCATGKASPLAGASAPSRSDQAEARRRAQADKRELEVLEARRFAEQQNALYRQMQLDIERNRLAATQKQQCQQRQIIAARGPHSKIKSNNRIHGVHSIPNPSQAGLPPCDELNRGVQ